uniref:Uncharacterized protein n=1 Tax=Sphaerodactylus townsendi TaxID=933632 RepID=A0ACB8FVK1_9SAUR
MAEDSESAASQQSLELDDQDTCGIDGDNEEETEHSKGLVFIYHIFYTLLLSESSLVLGVLETPSPKLNVLALLLRPH